MVRRQDYRLCHNVRRYFSTLAAQRKAAWADVARRIAHEIKNPLTPIQLSAERLRRKYINKIGSDTEVFETCTDTIIRHVEDIGRMVDEFSNFARLPVPQMRAEDLNDLCRQVLFLYRNGSRISILRRIFRQRLHLGLRRQAVQPSANKSFQECG